MERVTPGGEVTTRAVRYEPGTRRLLEAVVETRKAVPEDRDLVETLLSQVSVQDPPERARHVRAFGLELEAPEPMRLCGAEVKPADVRLDFAGYDAERDRELRTRASVRRMGMAESWYNGNAEALIKSRETGSRLTSFGSTSYAGHDATLARGSESGPLAKRALGLLYERRVLLWKCAERNALYAVSTSSPKSAPLEPEAFTLRCCGGAP
jgi:hypothetical protein